MPAGNPIWRCSLPYRTRSGTARAQAAGTKQSFYARFRDTKKVITEYKKATKDLRGSLDLMLTYLERGHAFTNDFGDSDEPFLDALLNMSERFVVELKMSLARHELYRFFRDRLIKMCNTSDIGWGYGDEIQWNVDELKKTLNL